MILVQQGKINLDDSVSKFIDDAPETWRNITIRRLLSHTGGLVREAPAFNALKVQPNIDIVRSVFPVAFLSPPGAKWSYSNVGYFTLAEIISRASGQPWPEFIQSHIFQVLGMTATRTTTASEIVLNRADGYQVKDGELNRAPEQLALRPSGAFCQRLRIWPSGMRRYTPMYRCRNPRANKCGLRSRSTMEPQRLMDLAGGWRRAEGKSGSSRWCRARLPGLLRTASR